MSEPNAIGNWIPLMDYALKTGLSLSTLRRYIKANRVQYKVVNGRYLLFVENGHFQTQPQAPSLSREVSVRVTPETQRKIDKLEQELQKANEEIAELKMLIALYEEKIPPLRLNS